MQRISSLCQCKKTLRMQLGFPELILHTHLTIFIFLHKQCNASANICDPKHKLDYAQQELIKLLQLLKFTSTRQVVQPYTPS
jgi:hypothetical protein